MLLSVSMIQGESSVNIYLKSQRDLSPDLDSNLFLFLDKNCIFKWSTQNNHRGM